jgi:dihydroneopterin aldolase
MKTFLDTIHFEDAAFQVHLGLTSEERAEPQPIFICAEFYLDFSRAMASDRIEDSVNYSELLKKMKDVVTARSFHLIEHMLGALFSVYLDDERLQGVRLTIKKPLALRKKGVHMTALTATRMRHE